MAQEMLRSPKAIAQKCANLVLQGDQGTPALKFYEDPETRSIWAYFQTSAPEQKPLLMVNIPGDTPLELATLLEVRRSLDELAAVAILLVFHFPKAFGQTYQALILQKLKAGFYVPTPPNARPARRWLDADCLEEMGLRQHMIQMLEPLAATFPKEETELH